MAEDYFCVLQEAITAGNKKKFEEAVIKGLLDVFRQLEELDALIDTDEDKTKLRGIVSDDLKVMLLPQSGRPQEAPQRGAYLLGKPHRG